MDFEIIFQLRNKKQRFCYATKKQLADCQQVAFYIRCRTRIRTSTNWTKTSCAAITPYDSPPERVCKYTFFYFCTNTQAKKYAIDIHFIENVDKRRNYFFTVMRETKEGERNSALSLFDIEKT